jgi:hypothetical protein
MRATALRFVSSAVLALLLGGNPAAAAVWTRSEVRG